MTLLDWILLVQLASSSYLVGVIWLIQRVHYPMLAELDPTCCAQSCRRHAIQITPVVGIPMLLEAAAAAALVWPGLFVLSTGSLRLAWLGLALVAALWASTFFVQVPLHDRLGRQSGAVDAACVRRLVATNWVRTVLWSARLLVAGALLIQTRPVHP